MDLRIVTIVFIVFMLLTGGFLVFVIAFGSEDSPVAPTGPGGAQAGPNKALEAQVLAGYEVKYWGDGRPFVNYYDPGAGEYGTQDIKQALFWQAQYGPGGEAAQMGAEAPTEFDGAECAYRLALIEEHGLFGYGINKGEAMRYYRQAKMGGHAEAKAAEQRLMAAGVK